MAVVFGLVAFLRDLSASLGLSSLFFCNYSVCSEVIRKMFSALVNLQNSFISCSSPVFARDTNYSREKMQKPHECASGKIPVCPSVHTQYSLRLLNIHL